MAERELTLYAILDLGSGKSYIGQTVLPLKYRFRSHQLQAEKRQRHPLYSAMAKRPSDFHCVPLLRCAESAIDEAERQAIRAFGTMHPDGYNLETGGKRGGAKARVVTDRMRGKVVSEETRRRLSESHLGQRPTPEQVAKIAAKLRGRKRSAEAIEKTRRAQRGRTVPEEQRRQIAETLRGRTQTEETKAKRRATMSRPDVKAKMSASMRGRKHSEATKAKMSAAHSTPEALARAAQTRGRKHSDATRAKMSASHRARYAS